MLHGQLRRWLSLAASLLLVLPAGAEEVRFAPQAGEAWYEEALAAAQVSLGNNRRLRRVIERARAGEDITIAAIGGSITEGAGAKT